MTVYSKTVHKMEIIIDHYHLCRLQKRKVTTVTGETIRYIYCSSGREVSVHSLFPNLDLGLEKRSKSHSGQKNTYDSSGVA